MKTAIQNLLVLGLLLIQVNSSFGQSISNQSYDKCENQFSFTVHVAYHRNRTSGTDAGCDGSGAWQVRSGSIKISKNGGTPANFIEFDYASNVSTTKSGWTAYRMYTGPDRTVFYRNVSDINADITHRSNAWDNDCGLIGHIDKRDYFLDFVVDIPEEMSGVQNTELTFVYSGMWTDDAFSKTSDKITPPHFNPGSGLTQESGCDQVKLDWNAANYTCEDNASYVVYREGSQIASIPLTNNVTTYTDNIVYKNGGYEYDVVVRLHSAERDEGALQNITGNAIKNFDDPKFFESVSLSTSDKCSQTIRLQWEIDDDVDIDFFEVERATDRTFTSDVVVETVTQTFGTISHEDSNVPVNQEFFYRIKAFDNCSNEVYILDDDIQRTYFEGPPSKPSILKIEPATDGSDEATITWSYPSDGTPVDYFQVYRDGISRSDKLPIGTTSFVDEGLSNCVEFEYKVVAGKDCFDEANSQVKQQVISFNTDLNGFDELEASKYYFNDRVSLRWTVSDDNTASEIVVYRKREGTEDNPEIIKRQDIRSSTFDDYDTEAGVIYRYGLLAISCPDYVPSKDEVSAMLTDVGVRSETGIINGKITYEGGNAVEEVRVLATPSDGENRGVSLSMMGNKLSIPLEKNSENWFPEEWSLSFWFRLDEKQTGEKILEVTDGTDYIRIVPEDEGSTSFDEIEYVEQTNIVGIEDELIGYLNSTGEIEALGDGSVLGKVEGTAFTQYEKEEISGLSSGDTLYHFVGQAPWMLKQGESWYDLESTTTSVAIEDSLVGYFRGDTVYESFDSDFVLAFIDNDYLRLAQHYNISYQLGESYASIKTNEMVFSDNSETKGDIVDDIVYSSDGDPIHMIKGNNVFYVYKDELNDKLVRGKRFARKVANDTDPEVSFDIFLLEKTITEEIRKGDILGIVNTEQTKVFENGGAGLTNYLIDDTGALRTARYEEQTIYVPVTDVAYEEVNSILISQPAGEIEYLLNSDRDILYEVSVYPGYLDAMDFIRATDSDEFLYFLGETLGDERQVFRAIGEEETILVENVTGTYTKEAYTTQLMTKAGSLSSEASVSSPELYLGEYNNIMLTYDGAELICFVNGASQDTIRATNLTDLFTVDDQNMDFGGFTGFLDEVLLWSEAKSQEKIDQDYSRYLSGGEDHLAGYWRLDEKVSNNAFDASYILDGGVRVFNGNHAAIDLPQWSNVVPEQEDLSFTAFTDSDGNYSIQSIIYSGSGNNFKLVPIYGAHSFEPSNKILFIGPSQQIQNEQDFIDNSSFTVTGTVKYDPRILGFDEIDDLSAPNCYVEGVTIHVDDQPVISESEFVKTDKFGRFEIEVPIGKHQIKVSRDNHTFVEETWPPEDDYNFQNHVYDLTFYDQTTRKLIGKIVGGTTEGVKLSGSGESVNNLGVAEIKLKSIGKTCFETILSTDPVTGEYSADLPPFRYNIVDLNIPSQSTEFNRELRGLAEATLDMSNDDLTLQAEACTGGSCESAQTEYHVIRDFVYRSPTEIKVFSVDNDSEELLGTPEIVDSETNQTLGLENMPYDVFLTDRTYTWDISMVESYVNYDGAEAVVYSDTIRNENIYIEDDISEVALEGDMSLGYYRYVFSPSEASILYNRANPLESFVKPIQVYTEDGKTWRDRDDVFQGYVLGYKNQGDERSFYTVAERGQEYQVVDLILRDPPGSQSYTTFTEETKLTKVTKTEFREAEVSNTFIGGGVKAKIDAKSLVISASVFELDYVVGYRWKNEQEKAGEEKSIYDFETELSLSTSDINANTGAGSDLFVGNAINIFVSPLYRTALIPLESCSEEEYECFDGLVFDLDSEDYTIGRYKTLGASVNEKETYFYYTQRQIEQLIADLEENVKNTDTSTDQGVTDSTRLGSQIRIWKSAIAQNEYEKLLAKYVLNNSSASQDVSSENISFGYGSELEKNYSIGIGNSLEAKSSTSSYTAAEIDLAVSIYTVQVKTSFHYSSSSFTSSTASATEQQTQELSIKLEDNDPGDLYSVDVVLNNYPTDFAESNELSNVYSIHASNPTDAQYFTVDTDDFDQIDNQYENAFLTKSEFINPIFITQGGRTSCPHEPEEKVEYLEYLKPEWLEDLKEKGIINDYQQDPEEEYKYIITENSSEDYVLNYGTFQRDQPGFRIEPRVQRGIPWDERATFDMVLENLNAEDTVRTYKLQVDQRTTGAGPTMRLDGERFIKGTDIALYGGEALTKTFTIRPVADVYDYENIVVYLTAGCQFDFGQDLDFQEDIFARDTLSVYFDPVCPQATAISPTDGWIINNQTGSTLEVEIQEQEFYFENHSKVKLQFKAAYQSDEDWVDAAVWTRDADEVMEQVALGENYFDFPEENNYIVYDWDTDGYTLPDGTYQIRWQYFCSNGLESYSTPISGVIDTTSPHAFGRPSPADGVLSPDEEIILTLNESVEAGLVDRDFISVKGKINGTNLTHPVSVRLSDSESDQIVIDNIQLKQTPITVEMWIRKEEEFASREQEIFYHGDMNGSELSLRLLSDGRLHLTLNDYEVTSDDAIPLEVWSHIAFSIDLDENKAALYQNAELIGFNESFVGIHSSSSSMILGGEGATSFTGNIHELRLWNKYMTAVDIAPNFYKDLTGREIGLVGYWPLTEGRGELSEDRVQGRNAQILADWWSEPASISFDFDGSNPLTLPSHAFADDEDFTIEFWFKSDLTGSTDTMMLVSNGNIEGLDWNLGINTLGQIFIMHNQENHTPVGNNVLDQEWHHIALVVNRVGKINMFYDGELTESIVPGSFHGFGGPAVTVGAQLSIDASGLNWSYDHMFSGQLDEFRMWRMARSQEQIERMSHYKLEGDEFGLVCYMPFEEYNDFLRISEGSLVCQDEYEQGMMGHSANPTFSVENPEIVLKPYETPVYFNYSVSGNQIIITLDEEDPASVENCILDVSVRNLVDQNGNTMKSPVTWSVFVDRNQVTWSDKAVSFEKALEEPLSFTSKVLNEGGEIQDFVIDNLPAWLTASPASGIIDPGSEVQVTFTVNEGLNIGYFQEPIYLRTDFGFNETLLLNLKVSAPLPEDWVFTPEDFEYNMNFIGQILIEGVYSTDEGDVVAAFVNDSIRGLASLNYQEVYDNYQVFLSVYSNGDTDEEFEFRIWDASKGIVLNDIDIPEVDMNPVVFTQNEIYGRPSSPVTFQSENHVMQQMKIPAGWKWISFNLESDDLLRTRHLFGDQKPKDGDRVLTMDALDIYDAENDLWIGNLGGDNLPDGMGGLQVENSYRVYLSEELDLVFSGRPVLSTSKPIKLYTPTSAVKPTRWNWISFLGQENMEVNEALASLNPQEGDLIKSQYAFGIYDPVLKWVGNLSFLTPGEGYLIQLSEDQQLVFPESGLINASARTNEVTEKYEEAGFNPHVYKDNMSMVIQVIGLDLNMEYPTLEVYHQDELRGLSEAEEVNGQPIYCLTIFGDEQEELDFKLNYGNDSYELEEEWKFYPSIVEGNIADPVRFTFQLENEPNLGSRVYPNPFDHQGVNFIFELSHEGFAQVNVISMTGKVLIDREFIGSQNQLVNFLWDGADDNGNVVKPGVYILKIDSGGKGSEQLIIKQ